MSQATLTWTANKEADLAGYNIYRNGAKLATVGKAIVTFVDVAPLEGVNTYNLTAFDTANNESAHSVDASITVNTIPPAAPAGLAVVLG